MTPGYPARRMCRTYPEFRVNLVLFVISCYNTCKENYKMTIRIKMNRYGWFVVSFFDIDENGYFLKTVKFDTKEEAKKFIKEKEAQTIQVFY